MNPAPASLESNPRGDEKRWTNETYHSETLVCGRVESVQVGPKTLFHGYDMTKLNKQGN